VKSTAMSGVKQFLKPDAYKQSELQAPGTRRQEPGRIDESCWHLEPGSWCLGDGVPFV